MSKYERSKKAHTRLYIKARKDFFKAPHGSKAILSSYKRMEYHGNCVLLLNKKQRLLSKDEKKNLYKNALKSTRDFKNS